MDQCRHVRGRSNVADVANDRGIFIHCFPPLSAPRLLGNCSRAISDYTWLRGSLFTSAASTFSLRRGWRSAVVKSEEGGRPQMKTPARTDASSGGHVRSSFALG